MDHLVQSFSLAELKTALWSMNSYKSPGPDDIQAHFYKYGWNTVSSSLLQFVNSILHNPEQLMEINQTFLCPIPKKECIQYVEDFHPISLCNTPYKMISKLVVNRIKPFLGQCIGPCQSSFVPGRSI